MSDAAELETLLGQAGTVVAGCAVKPLRVVQLPRFLRAVRPLLEDIVALQAKPTPAQVALVCIREPEAVLAAIAVATAQLPEDLSDGATIDAAIAARSSWLAGQGTDVLMELLVAVVEVNADFFLQSPSLAAMARAMATVQPGPASSQP